MFSRGLKDGVVPVHSVLYSLYFLRQISSAPLYGKKLGYGTADGHAVFADTVPVLFCRIRQIGGGWDSARYKRHASVYGRHLYRSYSACSPGLSFFGSDQIRRGHMVCMACRVDNRHGAIHFLLPKGMQKNHSITPSVVLFLSLCYTYGKKDVAVCLRKGNRYGKAG